MPEHPIAQTDDPRIVRISIKVGDASEKPNMVEADALSIVLSYLDGKASLESISGVLGLIKSPLNIKCVLEKTLTTPIIEAEFRAAFHQLWTERGHRIREAIDDDRRLAEALRHILLAYDGPGMVLYRGEQAGRAARGTIGFNWTARRDVAHTFASGLCTLYPGGGVLLQTYADPEVIISGPSPHSLHLGEDEVILDPGRIAEVIELARYSESTKT